MGQPGLLDLRAERRLANRLDGGYGATGNGADRQHARAHSLAVQVHGAGTALGDATTEFGAGQPQHVTHHPEQRHIIRHVQLMLGTVHG